MVITCYTVSVSFFDKANTLPVLHYHGLASRTKIYEGGDPRRLQARSWLTRPVRDRQAQPQRLQMKIWAGCCAEASRFSLLLVHGPFWLTVLPPSFLLLFSFWPCGCFRRRCFYRALTRGVYSAIWSVSTAVSSSKKSENVPLSDGLK